MPARSIGIAVAVLFANLIWGQAPAGESVSQVFHFTYTQTAQGFQEITNTIRTLAQIVQASLNASDRTLTVSGTTTQIAMAAWLFSEMDQPASPSPATQEFRPAGSANDVVRILYLTHGEEPRTLQEIVNTVRVIPELTKVFPYIAQNAIAMRGTDNDAEFAEWLVRQLDLPAGIQPAGKSAAAYEYQQSGRGGSAVRVYYATHPQSAQSFQEIVNTLRTIPELTYVFPCTAVDAVTLRGPAPTVALATWLFNHLDQPSGGQPQFQMPGGPDDVTQVFYLAPTTSTDSLQSIVTAVRGASNRLRAFPNTTLKAVTMRGTATQIAAADLLIKQMDNQ